MQLVQPYAGVRIDKVAGIEARGFILGGAVAHQLSVGFVPVRKKGKLPWKVIGEDYSLEYGVDRVEIHEDAVTKDEHVIVVDDLIATGGTAFAAIKLLSAPARKWSAAASSSTFRNSAAPTRSAPSARKSPRSSRSKATEGGARVKLYYSLQLALRAQSADHHPRAWP